MLVLYCKTLSCGLLTIDFAPAVMLKLHEIRSFSCSVASKHKRPIYVTLLWPN